MLYGDWRLEIKDTPVENTSLCSREFRRRIFYFGAILWEVSICTPEVATNPPEAPLIIEMLRAGNKKEGFTEVKPSLDFLNGVTLLTDKEPVHDLAGKAIE